MEINKYTIEFSFINVDIIEIITETPIGRIKSECIFEFYNKDLSYCSDMKIPCIITECNSLTNAIEKYREILKK